MSPAIANALPEIINVEILTRASQPPIEMSVLRKACPKRERITFNNVNYRPQSRPKHVRKSLLFGWRFGRFCWRCGFGGWCATPELWRRTITGPKIRPFDRSDSLQPIGACGLS
jgi:hypothetical protein